MANSPLTETNFQDLKKALQGCELAKNMIKQAQQAGINVDTSLKEVEDKEKQIRSILQVYFPGR